jgi:hypothetical protein
MFIWFHASPATARKLFGVQQAPICAYSHNRSLGSTGFHLAMGCCEMGVCVYIYTYIQYIYVSMYCYPTILLYWLGVVFLIFGS